MQIEDMEFLGSFWRVSLRHPALGDDCLRADMSINAVRRLAIETGSTIRMELPADRLWVFPPHAGNSEPSMIEHTSGATPAAPRIKPKTSKDDRIMVGFILVICLYLLITLAFPLYAMLSKSFSTYAFDLTNFEFQINTGDGWSEPFSAAAQNEEVQKFKPEDLVTSSDGRLAPTELFPDFSFRSPTLYKLRQVRGDTSFLFGTERVDDTDWHEYSSNDFRRIVVRASAITGLDNFRTYFSTPALFRSIENSLFIAVLSTIITVSLAFGFAYAINRSTMRFKGLFKLIAMIPILVPSLLPGIALVYLFGNQGMIKGLLMGESIYGPIGIVIGSVFFTFPHALIIITTALGDFGRAPV